MSIATRLFGLARTPLGGRLISIAARLAPQRIPGVFRVTTDAVFIRHPRPIGAMHLLAIPRSMIADAEVFNRSSERYWSAVQSWIEHAAEASDIRVGLTNLGTRQDVRLLHAHLMPTVPEWAMEREVEHRATTLAAALRLAAAASRPRQAEAGGWTYAFFRAAGSTDWTAVRDGGTV